jgi:hypothetical protein
VLKDGESKLFHLKAGDKKIFVLDEFFNAEKEKIQISSFNYKMTNYKMNVEVIHQNNLIDIPVNENWIGGQSAMIQPSASIAFNSIQYRVIINAIENGVFNVEARTSNSVIHINDRNINFEWIKQNENLCFSYNIESFNKNDDLIINMRSIKGDMNLILHPKNDFSEVIKERVLPEKENRFSISKHMRLDNNAGEWLICVEGKSEKNLFSLQVYINTNEKKVNEYKKLLSSIL